MSEKEKFNIGEVPEELKEVFWAEEGNKQKRQKEQE